MCLRSKIAMSIAALAFAISLPFGVTGEEPREVAMDDEVIIVDEEPAAFYERAPRDLARKVVSTIRKLCVRLPETTVHCAEIDLLFLREVSELGRRTDNGYVCVAEDLYLRNKYFSPASVLSNPSCVPVACYDRRPLCEASAEALVAARRRWAS
jgi:hypothetical protein